MQYCPEISEDGETTSSQGPGCLNITREAGRALNAAVCARDLLKEVTIIFITSTIIWSQVKQQGGNTAPPITENWIKDLLSMGLPIRTRPSFPLSQSLPSGSFLYLFIRGQEASYPYPSEDRKNENYNHRKLIKLITWTTALSNSMKL